METVTVYVDIDLKELIPNFITSRKDDIRSLRQALARQNYSEIGILAHTLKGIGGGYGFDFITELGGKMEQAAKRGDQQELTSLIDTMEHSLERVNIVYED